MTPCPDIERELSAYLRGDLKPESKKLVREHLDRCIPCRAELARETNLSRTLGSLSLHGAPAELETLLATEISSTVTGRAGRGRITAAVLAAAACLAVALLVPSLRPGSPPEPTWSEQEIAAGRRDVLFSLALTARVLDRTRKEAVVEVFADRLPRAINESLKTVKPNNSGGNG